MTGLQIQQAKDRYVEMVLEKTVYFKAGKPAEMELVSDLAILGEYA